MKRIFLIAFAFINIAMYAQTGQNPIKLHAINTGFGGFYIKNKIIESGGASFFADITTSLHNNLITASYFTGAEIGVVGSSTFNFNEFSLLYGREIIPNNWLAFEFFAGIGYYKQNHDITPVLSNDTISFPLRVYTKFYFNKKFGMGLNTNYSINRINNNLSFNLLFHYRFNTKNSK